MTADDATLRLLHGSAHALLYPTRGAGLETMLMEAIACGCPVIACTTPYLLGAHGQAVIHGDGRDPPWMADCLVGVHAPAVRVASVATGRAGARLFSVAGQAVAVIKAVCTTTFAIAAGRCEPLGAGWRAAQLQGSRATLDRIGYCHRAAVSRGSRRPAPAGSPRGSMSVLQERRR